MSKDEYRPLDAPFLHRTYEESANLPFEEREKELNEYDCTQRVEGDVIWIEGLEDA